MKVSDVQLAEKIHDQYLVNKYADGEARYRLLPTQEDRDSWVALVERYPDAGGDDRIGKAYRFFLRKIHEVDDPDDEWDVRRIEQAVAAKLAIVVISAHSDDNVHRIFESLNYKGQPLTQADLLRNYLFMRLPARGNYIHQHQWLPLQRLLNDSRLEQLVWLDLVLRGDDRATQEAIYRSQQQRLDRYRTEEELEEWVTELYRKARLFNRILYPLTEPSRPLRRVLERLERWGAGVVHPIALHVLAAHDSGRLSDAEAAQALRVVESYLVRRMIVGISSTGSNRILMTLVKELGDAVPTAEAVTKALSGPRKRYPTDGHVRDAVVANNFYWTGRGPQRTYVLRSLEEDYRHDEPIDFSRSKLTIEHVMPQSPSDEWIAMLDRDCEEDETGWELHAGLVHTLGNLTLTAYNAKLGNDDFEDKKQLLADSGLAMNREIAQAQCWGKAEILDRARALAERIIRIWPGPDESVGVPAPNPKWSLMNQILASIPAGRWTSYSDVAELISSHQLAVGNRLAGTTTPNAHRVLKLRGTISPDFRWPDPDRNDDPKAILEAEGVRFDDRGRADANQRMTATELAEMAELDVDDESAA